MTMTPKERQNNNVKVCSLCYCYVCDVEASKCQTWKSHCCATDSGCHGQHWTAARRRHKEKKTRAVDLELPTQPPADNLHLEGVGPFPPDTLGASRQNTVLTKCRKCGWFNKFAHKDFKFDRDVAKGIIRGERKVPRWYRNTYMNSDPNEIHPTGYMDWCHACGCVASARDFRKAQSKSYAPSQYSIFLGTKTIEFRLKAHDPREMGKYSEKWAQEEWTYNETEMERELFEHRLGELPLLEMIVASIPITTEDKIPSDGKDHKNDRYEDRDLEGYDTKASVSETEAVLIDNTGDSLILKELFKTSPTFGTKPIHPLYIDGDIKAVWDSNTRKGVSTFSH
jgi:hypothetical protein